MFKLNTTFALVACLLGGLVLPQAALAAYSCAITHPPYAVPLSAVTVEPNTPVGQIIGSASGYAFPNRVAWSNCGGDGPGDPNYSSYGTIVGSTDTGRTITHGGQTMRVYSTGKAGVGFALKMQDTNRPPYRPMTTSATVMFQANSGEWGLLAWGYHGVIYLVATGPITTGSFSARNIAVMTVNNTSLQHFISIPATTVTVRNPTCSFRSLTVPFPMGSVDKNVFDRVGAPGPWAANQSLISNGCTGVTQVRMSFRGTAAVGNSNAFAVKSGGAQGVGIELWQSNRTTQIVPNGAALNYAPQASGGAYTFSTRYIRTGTVTRGRADADVTVIIDYI